MPHIFCDVHVVAETSQLLANYYYLVWPSESILRISEMHVKLPSITKECFSELSTACDPCGFHASTPTFASVGWVELKGGISRSACANLTLYQLHYEYLHEDVVQITYASAVVIREVCGCTPIRVRLTVRIVTTRYLQRFRTALQGLNSRHYACAVVKTRVLRFVRAGLLSC